MHYMFYQGEITDFGVKNAQILIADAHRQGVKDLTFCICSGGGDVVAGIGLFHFLQMFEMNVRTHAAGFCGSIAATIFLAGKERTVAPFTGFNLHQATFSDGPNVGKRSPYTELISRPFKDKCGWTDQDLADRFLEEDFRFDDAKSLELGVAHRLSNVTLNAGEEMITVRTV
jgi:hypothetical protein